MKIKLLALSLLLLGLSACIKSEPAYREADIVDMVVDDDAFLTRGISENTVQLVISNLADYTHITPIITLSPGATVNPASGVSQDFSNDKTVTYRVTAEDGIHYKDYVVSVIEKISLRHEFGEWKDQISGTLTYPIVADLLWANANQGIILAMVLNYMPKGIFPTDKTDDCVSEPYAAKMETLKGPGKILNMNIPLASGSLFRGEFSYVFGSNPLKALRLGVPHPEADGIPSLFNGYYKYTPGETFTDEDGNVVPGRIDEMSMYAVIFKVTKGAAADKEYLDGETILTSDRVVGRAEWAENGPGMTFREGPNGFTGFSIPFVYTEALDFEENDYRLTIVCSSSKDGNEYMGAVGSTLIVDNLEIICDPIE